MRTEHCYDRDSLPTFSVTHCSVCDRDFIEGQKVFKEDNEWHIYCSEFCHSIRKLRNLSSVKLYFDGGSDTYIYESGADNITFVTGSKTIII
jgi:hypothetical protein